MNWMKLKKWRYQIPFKLRLGWWRVKYFVTGLAPTRCFRCGGWWLNRDTRDVKSTLGVWVPVCLRCYEELYGDE